MGRIRRESENDRPETVKNTFEREFFVYQFDSAGESLDINLCDTLKEARKFVIRCLRNGTFEDGAARFVIDRVRSVFRDDGKLLSKTHKEIEVILIINTLTGEGRDRKGRHYVYKHHTPEQARKVISSWFRRRQQVTFKWPDGTVFGAAWKDDVEGWQWSYEE
jgi:hypothetical protein